MCYTKRKYIFTERRILVPNIYTHHRFGLLLRSKLPKFLQDICNQHPDFYFLGQQGPDILYAHPKLLLGSKRAGDIVHRQSGKKFLEIQKTWKEQLLASPEALAYLLGSLCHFILDAFAHEKIYKMQHSAFDHYTIETELDRSYLRLDGKDDRSFPLESLIHINPNYPQTLLPFYSQVPNLNETILKNSIQYFKSSKALFFAGHTLKEYLLMSLMSLPFLRKYKGFVMRSEIHKNAKQSFELLNETFLYALDQAPKLLENAYNFLTKDEELLPFFNYNYEGVWLGEGREEQRQKRRFLKNLLSFKAPKKEKKPFKVKFKAFEPLIEGIKPLQEEFKKLFKLKKKK